MHERDVADDVRHCALEKDPIGGAGLDDPKHVAILSLQDVSDVVLAVGHHTATTFGYLPHLIGDGGNLNFVATSSH